MIKRFIVLLFLFPICLHSNAQVVTSPYSILGIGDIESKDYGKFFGMSSASTGIQSSTFVNLANPASVASLDPHMLNLDFNLRWRSSQYKFPQFDTFSPAVSDAQLQRLSLTFRPGNSWGLSFGFKPFSTVNYLLRDVLTLPDGTSSDIQKTVTGSGGINQAFLTNSFKLNKNFSVGLTTSFLFGSIKTATFYNYVDLGTSITRNEYQVLKGFQFQGGFQYTGKISKGLKQTFGLTLTSPTNLKGTYEVDYVSTDTTLNTKNTNKSDFKIPLQFTAGYSIVIHDNVTIAADYKFANWDQTKLNYPNTFTTQSQRFSLGFQYAPLKNIGGQMREKYFIQGGIAYDQSYILLNNHQLDDKSATLGVGSNVTRFLNVYLGLEIGSRGSNADGQIREQYTQISAGMTLKEFWFNTKKLRRYQ
jgi:hypothetical protein